MCYCDEISYGYACMPCLKAEVEAIMEDEANFNSLVDTMEGAAG